MIEVSRPRGLCVLMGSIWHDRRKFESGWGLVGI